MEYCKTEIVYNVALAFISYYSLIPRPNPGLIYFFPQLYHTVSTVKQDGGLRMRLPTLATYFASGQVSAEKNA